MRLAAALVLALPFLQLAGGAWAQAVTDAPVATADRMAETDAQIAAFLQSPPELGAPPRRAVLPTELAPLRPHGEVSVAVGTHGYRSVYGRVDAPIGETGMVSIAVGESRFKARGARIRDGLPAPYGPGSPSGSLVGATGFEPATP